MIYRDCGCHGQSLWMTSLSIPISATTRRPASSPSALSVTLLVVFTYWPFIQMCGYLFTR